MKFNYRNVQRLPNLQNSLSDLFLVGHFSTISISFIPKKISYYNKRIEPIKRSEGDFLIRIYTSFIIINAFFITLTFLIKVK